jgi:hypothetical protein
VIIPVLYPIIPPKYKTLPAVPAPPEVPAVGEAPSDPATPVLPTVLAVLVALIDKPERYTFLIRFVEYPKSPT